MEALRVRKELVMATTVVNGTVMTSILKPTRPEAVTASSIQSLAVRKSSAMIKAKPVKPMKALSMKTVEFASGG